MRVCRWWMLQRQAVYHSLIGMQEVDVPVLACQGVRASYWHGL